MTINKCGRGLPPEVCDDMICIHIHICPSSSRFIYLVLQGGYYTPEQPSRRSSPAQQPDGNSSLSDLSQHRRWGSGRFQALTDKAMSFKSTVASLRGDDTSAKTDDEGVGHEVGTMAAAKKAQAEQGKSAEDAAKYRARILAAQSKGTKKKETPASRRPQTDEEDLTMSPGHHREQAYDRARKSAKQKGGAKPSAPRDATFSQCVFNLANILMGVGLLGLPYIFQSAGWAGGFFIAFFFAGVTWRTSILIGRELNGDPRPGNTWDDNPYKSPIIPGSSATARMRKPMNTFPDIARESFGETGCVVLSSVLYFELFSCLAIFFVSLGDHLFTLFPEVSQSKHMCFVAIALTIPTALLRTPRLLSYLSAVGTFATIAVVVCVVASAVSAGDITESLAERYGRLEDTPHHILWRTSGLPLALGLIAYAFSGHAIVPSIYSSMKKPQEYEYMVTFTFSIVVACCCLVATSGYYMFGSFVEDQITISLATAGTAPKLAMDMLTWLMILTAFSKFTLTMFPLALGLEEIVAPYVPTETAMEVASSLIKLILIVLALAVAIFFPSFSFLCSLVGLICTMIVSVIFPAGAHLVLFGERLPSWEKALDWLFIVGGTLMAVVGTIATLT